MIEPAIIVARLMQYSGAAVLGGSSLFFLYAAPQVWPRKLLASAAVVLLAAALLSVVLQAILFAGSIAGGMSPAAIGEVVAYLPLAQAALVRATAALAALSVLITRDGRSARLAVAGFGLIAAATLAWMSHAGASESWAHLLADIVHVLAATLWLGALAGLLVVARQADAARLHAALARFSALGVPLMAALALSGLVNGWYLVGIEGSPHLLGSAWGQLMLGKLALFAAMLGLAALNRYRLTRQLVEGAVGSLLRARQSIALEAVLGFAVLALVAAIGMLQPPAAA